MTLLELAQYICGKVNQTEAEDVAACRQFLTRRHELIWHEDLWKDSLVEYRLTLDPDPDHYTVASPWLPAKGVLLLPPIIQRVMAVRTSRSKLNVQRQECYYRTDYDAFVNRGAPAEYVLLSPCVWEWNSGELLLVKREDMDGGQTLSADLLDSDSAGVSRATVSLAADWAELGQSERVDAVIKPTTNAAVSVGAAGPVTVQNNDSQEWYFATGSSWANQSGQMVAAGATARLSRAAFVFVAPSSGEAYATDQVATGAAWGGAVTYNGLTLSATRANPTGATLAASDTNAPRRQRVRLIHIPDRAVELRVLGKRRPPAFSAELDEPAIAGIENCLIAFGLADMLERDESHAEALGKFQEATLLLDQLKRGERSQQAHHARVIPEHGYGAGPFGPGGWGAGKGNFF